MTVKVIGAGFGRTGTLSLKAALEQLGFDRCYHMVELIENPDHVVYWEAAEKGEKVDWDRLFERYQATVDYPGYRHYKALMRHYPDAKVILTVRDTPDAWYESAYQTIYKAGPPLLGKLLMLFQLPFSARLRKLIRVFRLTGTVVWKKDFQGRFEDRAFAISVYERHIEEAKQHVPPERLLIFNVKEGWDPLCRFLEVPVPEGKPFPRVNDRESFQRNSRQVLKRR